MSYVSTSTASAWAPAAGHPLRNNCEALLSAKMVTVLAKEIFDPATMSMIGTVLESPCLFNLQVERRLITTRNH